MYSKTLSFAAMAATAFAQSEMSLTDVLGGTDSVSTLAMLANQTGVLQSLQSTPNITIFAPTNSAFEDLMSTEMGSMIANNTQMLMGVLQYHVVMGMYDASSIPEAGAFIPTLYSGSGMMSNSSMSMGNMSMSSNSSMSSNGQIVEAIRNGSDVTLYSAARRNSSVTMADVMFANGIVHLIDRVMIPPYSVSRTANQFNDLSALVGALTSTNLASAVNMMPNVTVFAPNNMAFQSVTGGDGVGSLDEDALATILQYHVANMTAYSTDLMNGTMVPTLQGNNITVFITEDGAIFANGARVVTPNIITNNGVIHVIDDVLNPENTMPAAPTATEGMPAFTGASSMSDLGSLTSGVSSATMNLPSSTFVNPSATAGGAMSSSSGGAMPMKTGAVGAAALFGAGAAMYVA